MEFLEQLRAEVELHGDMQTDFRSRRYHQAKNLAAKYVDMIEEQARISARCGDYEILEGRALIQGIVYISVQDFEQPLTVTNKVKARRYEIAVNPENDLFEVFLLALAQLCEQEHITCAPMQALVADKEGKLTAFDLPMTVKNPKKEKIEKLGFPYQITF